MDLSARFWVLSSTESRISTGGMAVGQIVNCPSVYGIYYTLSSKTLTSIRRVRMQPEKDKVDVSWVCNTKSLHLVQMFPGEHLKKSVGLQMNRLKTYADL